MSSFNSSHAANEIAQLFSEDELKLLCDHLSVDYENLPGNSKLMKSRELIKYFERQGNLQQLVNAIHNERPNYKISNTLPLPKPSNVSGNQKITVALFSSIVIAFAVFSASILLSLVKSSETQNTKKPLQPFATSGVQNSVSVRCGDSVVSEFTKVDELLTYRVELKPNDILFVIGRSVGSTLFFAIRAFDPLDTPLAMNGKDGAAENNPKLQTPTVSMPGFYLVEASNSSHVLDEKWKPSQSILGRGGGKFSLTFKCVRDGKEYVHKNNPNTNPIHVESTATQTPSNTTPDSQSILEAEWIIGNEPIRDAIDVTSSRPTIYKFSAIAKQSLKLSLKRLSGNINLRIVVLGPDDRPILDTEIATMDDFNSNHMLPMDGMYLIQISKAELNPPAKPKATSFELTATVK